ncbi:MAG: hypothetical protein KIT80_11865 [Chitinophagaceae bacterium]|nr:hypothetical protein [Chitinophagaceae bacterium]MCW5927598.1 hypothetical protein [Chitinophagaceae bacterium]
MNNSAAAGRSSHNAEVTCARLKDGVVLGYDRNDKTIEAFRSKGFAVINVKDLLNQLEAGAAKTDNISDTLILMPSAELSRARGGFHYMSMPVLRDTV